VKPSAGRSIHDLKMTLRGSAPIIWRRVLVSSDSTLEVLHRIVQYSFGWHDSHLHVFVVGREQYGPPDPHGFAPAVNDERGVRLSDVAVQRAKIVYEYDFGDSWLHDIVVEQVRPAADDEIVPYCVSGARAGPPEDSGGVHGYKELLAIWKNERHEAHEEIREWLGDDFSPRAFDRDAVNAKLRLLDAKSRRPRGSSRPRRT
jgi:hypothetical protein